MQLPPPFGPKTHNHVVLFWAAAFFGAYFLGRALASLWTVLFT